MTYLRYGAVCLCVLFLFACGDQDNTMTKNVDVSATDVKRESKETLETLKAYTIEQREMYQDKIEAKLNELDSQIDTLRARAENATTAVQAEIDKAIRELQQQQETAMQQATALRDASGEAWSDLKNGLDNAVADLQQAYDKARSRF